MTPDEPVDPAEPSETDRFLADTVRAIDELEGLGLAGVEPATTFAPRSAEP